MKRSIIRFLATTFLATTFLAAIFALAAGCAHKTDIKTQNGYDHSVDFKAINTYTFKQTELKVNDPNGTWTPANLDFESEIKSIIKSQLDSRKMSEVTENCDAYVVLGINVDMENQEVLSDYKTGYEQFFTLPKSAILVTLVDAKTDSVIWAGAAEGQNKNIQDVDLAKKRLAAAVNGIFKGFPK